MPTPKANTLAQRYDRCLQYAHGKGALADARCPARTTHWHADNIELFERYERWLSGGGISELVTSNYHIPMAGHVFGLTLKHHSQLDLENDLSCALEYVKAKGVSETWLENCNHSLVKFRRFMRLERGLGEESQVKPFDVSRATSGMPAWLVCELERYQHLQQRNWRAARLENTIRVFWSHHLRTWRHFVEKHNIQHLADLKRKHVLDYIDHRLAKKYSVTGVNADLRYLHMFLLFLQAEGYTIPQSLLKMPSLKEPEPLPKYLSDEQVKKLRDEIERRVTHCQLASHRRLAILVRSAFYLLWQGGLRLGEVEEYAWKTWIYSQNGSLCEMARDEWIVLCISPRRPFTRCKNTLQCAVKVRETMSFCIATRR